MVVRERRHAYADLGEVVQIFHHGNLLQVQSVRDIFSEEKGRATNVLKWEDA